MTLLDVRNLTVEFFTEEGVVTAADGLSYQIDRGEKFGVVGESGAGKSVTALSLMRLIDAPGRITSGSIRFSASDAVESFESRFPDFVIDLPTLRAEHDVVSLAEQLEETGVSGASLTGNPDDQSRSLVDLARADAFDLGDIVGHGYAADLGLVQEDDFIVLDGNEKYVEVLLAPERAVRQLRGKHIAMIFQNAQTALNPVYSVGDQISEGMRHHFDYTAKEAKDRAVELLDQVGIPEAELRYSDYPHEFSGGMQQRAVIAMALSCDPDLLIADEPTTALDVTTEAKILDQIDELADEFDTAIQLITHDLGVIAELCDRVMVMYAGKPVEKAGVEDLFYDPKHPYTVGLMASIPRLGADEERLQEIPGMMPDLIEVPTGCSFHPRCPFAEDVCAQKTPSLVDPSSGSPRGQGTTGRGASCLAYTGELSGRLSYDVSVQQQGLEGQSARGESDD